MGFGCGVSFAFEIVFGEIDSQKIVLYAQRHKRFTKPITEPHLSLLPVGQAVCGASRCIPKRETGLGCTDGTGERGEGSIDRYPANEGRGEEMVGRK